MPTLNWLHREQAVIAAGQAPYRLLEDLPELSYSLPSPEVVGQAERSSAGERSGMLIHGDNLDALKALLTYYAGQVKCIYIDPPYNPGRAFEHYDDSLEHSTWLSLMYPHLELLCDLLAEDGSIWVSIDDAEAH